MPPDETPTLATPAEAPATHGRRAFWIAALASAAIVLATGVVLWRARPTTRESQRSFAVLPLRTVGGDSAQEYLADGMTDELATAFGRMPGLRVASRTLAGRYRGVRDLDVRAVGRALGVAYVLQGTVRRMGDKLRVSAQLTSTADGVELWSDSYDRRAADVFAVQDDIARGVAAALQLARLESSYHVSGTSDQDAYDLYLRGRFLLGRRGPGVRQAAEDFERAIARDSMFAAAHAGLATALELFPYFAATSARSVFDRATTAAQRALALDSSLAEAHTALGLAFMHAYDWDRAGVEFRKAIDVDSTDASAHHQYGRFLVYTAYADSALGELRLAKALEPLSAVYSTWIAIDLALLRRPKEALVEIRRALEIDSLNIIALYFGSRVLLDNDVRDEARAAARRLPDLSPWNGGAAYTLARVGDRAAATRIVRSLLARRPGTWFDETAIAYGALGLGDTATALTALERATDLGEIWPSFTAVSDTQFGSVRANPRFAALLGRVHLNDHSQSFRR